MIVNNFLAEKSLIKKRPVRLHLTNIAGLGASHLLKSLLPALVKQASFKLEEVFLPVKNDFLELSSLKEETKVTYYRRYLPNSISRFLECTVFGSTFNGNSPLLVFGDLPIKCKGPQTVFLQNTLLLPESNISRQSGVIKYWVLRWVFRRNLKYVSRFIVQTKAVKSSLINSYPEFKGRVNIVSQPVHTWLLNSNIKQTKFNRGPKMGLRLFYPAAFYPHKNHQLLSGIDQQKTWPVSEIILTIADNLNPNIKIPWIRCVGKLETDMVLKEYKDADALLFLSLTESFGFPLIEAMWLGLPIICPDLPYARTLCGEQAIYFDPCSIASLHVAIIELKTRHNSGFKPDWKSQLAVIPKDWHMTANAMLKVTCGDTL